MWGHLRLKPKELPLLMMVCFLALLPRVPLQFKITTHGHPTEVSMCSFDSLVNLMQVEVMYIIPRQTL